MNKKLIFSVLLAVCLLTVVSVVVFAQNRPGPNVRWEYTVLNTKNYTTNAALTSEMNKLGGEGWELQTALTTGGELVFKRRLP